MSELDKADEEELLLIISGLGMPDEGPNAEYKIDKECHECVNDLQRYLRRDNPHSMACHRALGKWRVLTKHLCPILQRAKDTALIFNVLKVIVKITMKPDQLGVKMLETIKEQKEPDPLIGRHYRELVEYHRMFTGEFSTASNLNILVRLLAEPLARPEHARTEEESMVIELILALLLNILHTAPPDAPPPVVGQSNVVVQDALTLRKLVVVLDEEHGLDILLYILQHIEEHEAYRGWNLTLLEIVYYVLSSQKPAAVFKVGAKETATAKEPTASVVSAESAAAGSTAADADEPATDGMGASTTAAPSPSENAKIGGLLGDLLDQRKAQRKAMLGGADGRHSSFGGLFRVKSQFGDKELILPGRQMLTSAGGGGMPQASKRRVSRNRMPLTAPPAIRDHPKSKAAVKRFAELLRKGPMNALVATVMKDLEGFAFGGTAHNASKVLPHDHAFFAATAAWILEAHRFDQAALRQKEASLTHIFPTAPPFCPCFPLSPPGFPLFHEQPKRMLDVGPVGALAEIGVYNLALRLCRDFEDRKLYMQLSVLVGLLKQLFLFLDEMMRFGDYETQRVAQLLRHNIFYEGEVIKLLETLFKAYEPFRMPPSYLADVVVMTHAVLRQLEQYGGNLVKRKVWKRKPKKSAGDAAAAGAEGATAEGAIGATAPEDPTELNVDDGPLAPLVEEVPFDFEEALFKFVQQREVLSRYISLLRHFKSQPEEVMHAACKLISRAVKQCKLEPMFFHIDTLLVYDEVLRDAFINQPQHKELRHTVTYLVRRSFEVAKQNPALFVE